MVQERLSQFNICGMSQAATLYYYHRSLSTLVCSWSGRRSINHRVAQRVLERCELGLNDIAQRQQEFTQYSDMLIQSARVADQERRKIEHG